MIRISTFDQYDLVVDVLNGLIKKPSFVKINSVEIPKVQKFSLIETEDSEMLLCIDNVNVQISGKIIEIAVLRSEADIIFIDLIEDENLMQSRETHLEFINAVKK